MHHLYCFYIVCVVYYCGSVHDQSVVLLLINWTDWHT